MAKKPFPGAPGMASQVIIAGLSGVSHTQNICASSLRTRLHDNQLGLQKGVDEAPEGVGVDMHVPEEGAVGELSLPVLLHVPDGLLT